MQELLKCPRQKASNSEGVRAQGRQSQSAAAAAAIVGSPEIVVFAIQFMYSEIVVFGMQFMQS